MIKARRRRPFSMTSLIDVIFLLLLFFMLSSTFSKYGHVEMQVGAAGEALPADNAIMFLRLGEDQLSLNGVTLALAGVPERLLKEEQPTVVVSVTPRVTAQRMTDLLVALRDVPEARVVLLGGG